MAAAWLLAVVCLLVPGISRASTVRVPVDFATIQAGINASITGDTVLVAPGSYTGEGNRDLDFQGQDIVLASESGPDVTTIDCQGSQSEGHRGINFHSGETRAALVEGFTIRNGFIPYYSYPVESGGAIRCFGASPTIRHCRFVHNFVAVQAAPPGGYGGGVCSYGGGFPSIEFCTFDDNAATYGGAIAATAGSVIVRGCSIKDSWGAYGAAIYVLGGEATLEFCTISSTRLVAHSVIYSESSQLTITSCAIAGNQCPIGIYYYYDGSLTLANTIIAFNDGVSLECGAGSKPTVSCCNVYGNWFDYDSECLNGEEGINGNFRADPAFCALESGDFRLAANSPCLPGNHPNGKPCGLIGPLREGCAGSAVEAVSWGRVKARFR